MERKKLFHKAKGGELREWSIWTDGALIKTEYGVKDGQLQTSEFKAVGKNTGRSNATTDEQQAEKEAQALYKFKLDRKYSETEEGAQEPLLLPMLAKEIEERKVNFPCYIQPKFDGVRCLAFWESGKIKLLSRSGKEWTVPKHINEQLEKILPQDCMFDGELYIHGVGFQTIASYVKKWRDVETPTVEYHVYDMPIVNGDDNLSFEERHVALWDIFFGKEDDKGESIVTKGFEAHKILDCFCIGNICLAQTMAEVDSMKTIKEWETKWVSEGFEGAIVRNPEGKYIFGYRSDDLLKVKTFKDSEFVVLDCRDGVGKFEGCAVWICKNDTDDQSFECTMSTSMANKKDQFENKKNYIGEKLTVKYFERTDSGLPRFPTGLCFRPPEDLN